MWNLLLVCLQTVLVSVQHRGMFCAQHTIGSEIIFTAPDGILGDVGHLESRFGPFRDGVSVRARYVYGLRQTYHRLRNHFGRTRWYS
jgi:hypothetical protein